MPDVVLRKRPFRMYVEWIARFGESIEVLPRCQGLGICIAALELEVMREPFLNAQVAAVIGGCPGVLVGPDGRERRIRPRRQVIVHRRCTGWRGRVQSVHDRLGKVRVDFTELPESEYALIPDFNN